MTLLQLKYIVKIVECGSMNEASHALYVSQPALSSSVKELENALGIEIFTRSSQGIALTVDGAEFLTYARQVLDQADLLEERYKHAKPRKQLCQVSTQHYMFAVEAFVEMISSSSPTNTSSPSARPARATSSTKSPTCSPKSASSTCPISTRT